MRNLQQLALAGEMAQFLQSAKLDADLAAFVSELPEVAGCAGSIPYCSSDLVALSVLKSAMATVSNTTSNATAFASAAATVRQIMHLPTIRA